MTREKKGLRIIGEKTLAMTTTPDINIISATTETFRTKGTILVPALQVQDRDATTITTSNTKTVTQITMTTIIKAAEELPCGTKTKERNNAPNSKLWLDLPLPKQEISLPNYKKVSTITSLNLTRKCGAFPAPIVKKAKEIVRLWWISKTAATFILREYPGGQRKTRWEKCFPNLVRLKTYI